MPIHFLPDVFARATKTTVVVPVSGCPDLTDPSTGRVVIPAQVEIVAQCIEGSENDRTWLYVAVIGPRRLKSGEPGQPIITASWNKSRVDGARGYVDRPDWLTDLIDEQMQRLTPALSPEGPR